MDEKDYNKLLEKQGFVCAICKEKEVKNKHLCVDHNHTTGKVRGLLCQKCNRALGSFKEDYNYLRNAASYLHRYDIERTWDDYFVSFARLASTRSKDESSQVGAVIVKDKRVISTGYNGFPSGVEDNIPERHERPLKYLWTVHAEENAIFSASRFGISCQDASIYVTPFHPCSKCARGIVQAGIKEVVVDEQSINPRFEEEFRIAKEIFDASNILVRKA